MAIRPLDWLPPVRSADWPAAAEAGRLLSLLGARVGWQRDQDPALSAGGVEVYSSAGTVVADWATSGAMALTGREDGPPLVSMGQPATVARGALLAIELISALKGKPFGVDGRTLLSERAALAGLGRKGDTSVGGAARILRCADGWWALNLPRESDFDLIDALIEERVRTEPWSAIGSWAGDRLGADIVGRAGLLGLAAGQLPSMNSAVAPWTLTQQTSRQSAGTAGAPLVVNLGALWAAPLCANLLGLAGCEVIDVESESRPDNFRVGNPALFDLLHEGHTRRPIDFTSAEGRRELQELVTSADVVIEASRPRALQRLGLSPEHVLFDGRPRTWIQITGHGASAPNRIAFGDDAAVAGGLVAFDQDGPVFAGDAIADPLTGILAATAATACLDSPHATLVQICMRDVAAYCAAQPTSDAERADPRTIRVIAPRLRTHFGR